MAGDPVTEAKYSYQASELRTRNVYIQQWGPLSLVHVPFLEL
jgi:hypothetical protein